METYKKYIMDGEIMIDETLVIDKLKELKNRMEMGCGCPFPVRYMRTKDVCIMIDRIINYMNSIKIEEN